MAQTIQSIVQRIAAQCGAAKRAPLFGFRAHGEPDEGVGDLDLLVVNDTQLPPLERCLTIRQGIEPHTLPVDIFVVTPEEFEETKDVIGGIAYAPANYGRVLYEKP